jgi:crotonobetainyl-CoA:carnitine CoA-transferase CaiB-like acyl-CoA transferase
MSVLKGIRVLDFGRYLAGPYCATLLGYLGAEVIRIERVGGGEDRRARARVVRHAHHCGGSDAADRCGSAGGTCAYAAAGAG